VDSFYSGDKQTWTDPWTGDSQPLDIDMPPYCKAPYTDEYRSAGSTWYKNLTCIALAEGEVWYKVTPTYLFFMTSFSDIYRIVAPIYPPDPE
jgi:hypothetical protein